MARRGLSRLVDVRKAPPYRAAQWFFRDFATKFKWRLAIITAVGFIAAGLQGSSLVTLNSIIAAGEGKPVRLPIPGLTVELSVPVIASGVIAALALSMMLTYWQSRDVLKLWCEYQAHSVARTLKAVREAAQRGAVNASVIQGPVMACLRQSHGMGALARRVAASIAPALRFFVFSSVAMMLNPQLTLILLFVTVPSGLLAILLFARRASRSARKVAILAPEATRDLKQRVMYAVAEVDNSARPETLPGISAFDVRARAVTDKILFVEQTKLMTGLIALATTTAFIGYSAPDGPVAWGHVLLYVIALLVAFRELVLVSSALSGFGRFYPAVQAYQSLLEILSSATSPDDFMKRVNASNLKVLARIDDDELE